MDVDQDSANVSFPPPFIYLGTLLAGFLADLVLPFRIDPGPLGRAAGGVLAAAGVFFLLSAAGLFRKAGTDVKPWKTTTAIVREGVYARTRNPMYLGMALVYAGLALFFSSLGALVLLPALLFVIQTQVIAREERYLEGKFGKPYLDYKAKVRRWL